MRKRITSTVIVLLLIAGCRDYFAPTSPGAGPKPALVSATTATIDVKVTDLGTLGGAGAIAFGINNQGQVVGEGLTSGGGVWNAFLWSAQQGMQNLGTFDGTDLLPREINDLGQIAAFSHLSASHALFWDPDSPGWQTLGTLSGYYGRAYGINNLGQVAGATYSTFYSYATVWDTRTGTMQILPGNYASSSAAAINDHGQIVGSALSYGQSATHAVVWTLGSPITVQDLNGLPGDVMSSALDINNEGQVVGYGSSSAYGSRAHAILWTLGPTPTARDIGNLGTEGETYARAINDKGDVLIFL